jgi:hypothetical protein
MSASETGNKFCVIGAGPCGLTVAKNFRQAGIPFDCYEREDDVGGNWYFGRASSRCYASTHMISSKGLTQYTDFPMPADYPHFPSHRQALAYLRSYAERFELYEQITFGTSVERIEPDGGGWIVQPSKSSEPKRYRGVVIANGHHWDPIRPSYPGEFQGEVMHAADYRSPEVLRGRRVLVVGAGNTGCDIAAEAGQHAEAAFHSLRRGYHFLPKFLFGKPIDVCGERLHRLRFPLWLRRSITRAVVWAVQGSPRRYGLPAPDHKLFETHPIVNSQLLYWAAHGAVRFKPEIERLDGDGVRFTGGSREQIDLIVYATGYKLSFPFIDGAHLAAADGRPRLFLNCFHPRHDNLFVAGLIQPDSGIWGLADLQMQLAAAFVRAGDAGSPKAEWFRRAKAEGSDNLGHGIGYVDSPRHFIEVEHYTYRRRLQQLLARLA